jgi:hypothetical protein
MANGTETCRLSAKSALPIPHEPTLVLDGLTLGAQSALACENKIRRWNRRDLFRAIRD